MAEAAVSFLLESLSLLIQNEAKLLGRLKPEVIHIRDELEHMKAFLRVAESKQESNPQLDAWVNQVRDIAYNIEDVLDRYVLQFANHGETGFARYKKKVSAPISNFKSRHQIASEIQTIKSRLEKASKGYQRYKDIYSPFMDHSSSSNPLTSSGYDSRGDALLLEDAEVVGIENPKKQLLEWISLSDEYGFKVISVVGMGGLGKTTLVKKVYDDRSIQDKFDHHSWITFSESYNIADLLKSMIKLLLNEKKQPMPQDFESMNADGMREFIKNYLQDKNYIIVLDDIWTVDAWETIKYVFPRSTTRGCGCVIVTTRFRNVGNAMSSETNYHDHRLEPLPEEASMQLFNRKAFRGKSCPLYLEKISGTILRRCGGLPLAIVLIGALLATRNPSVEQWELFNRNLGDELERDNPRIMKNLMSTSFYDLPYYLRSCFLYLSIFPEDAVLEKDRLIRLWIAAGFVQEKSGKTMEDVAQDYLNELVNRSLIQVAKISDTEEPTHFRIHDLIREYILLKSGHEVVIKNNIRDAGSPGKIRRIALDGSFNNMSESYNLESLRSLLWVGSEDSVSEEVTNKVLRRGCSLLKELDLEGAPIEIVPDEVYKLHHLKYLSLRSTKVCKISKSIKHLHNLETLDLKSTNVIELPVEVLKLHKLRHLLVDKFQDAVDGYYAFDFIQGFSFPYEIGGLLSLQILRYLIADEGCGTKTLIEIGKLTQLRELGLINIKKKDGVELCSSLVKLTNLRYLLLQSSEEDEVLDLQHSISSNTFSFLRTLILRGRLLKLPHWIASLDGLSELDLRWSRLNDNDEDPLDHLQNLPNLQLLVMHCAYEGEELNFKVGGFQRLKILFLQRLRKLRKVRVQEGSMPLLQKLFMLGCKKVEDVPQGVQYLSHLQYVDFSDMSEEFVDKIRYQKSIEKKLNHVPKVDVWSRVNGKWVLDFQHNL